MSFEPPRRFRFSVAAAALASTALTAPATLAQVAPDGRTATTAASGAGGVTDITTGTLSGGYGINSFSAFNPGAGSTVNIHAPAGTAGTVNIVTGPASRIDGAVRGIQAGTVGGELFIANSSGIVIGPQGSVHAGTVGLSAPSQGFIDGFFDASGAPRPGHVGAIAAGTAPGSGAAIDIAGQVRGTQRVILRTGGDIVLRPGARVTSGAPGGAGGHIDIRPGGDIEVQSGAVIAAEGEGAGHGGIVVVFADGSARLRPEAVISAAARGSGDGGFVEFSAIDLVHVQGILTASADGAGTPGLVFIDPQHVIVDTDDLGRNSNISILSTGTITVREGVTLSSRRVADPLDPATDHETAPSIGNSNLIRLEAPSIVLEDGARLLAHADSGFASGGVLLQARDTGLGAQGSVSIDITGATITGGNVTLETRVTKTATVLDAAGRAAYRAQIAADLLAGRLPSSDFFLDIARAELEANLYDSVTANFPALVKNAKAEIAVSVRDTTIRAETSLTITADATTTVNIPGGTELLTAWANSSTRADIVIENSLLSVTDATWSMLDTVTIRADARNTTTASAGLLTHAVIDTGATIRIRDSAITTSLGNVNILANLQETHNLSAVGGTVAGVGAPAAVIAGRKAEALVLVDAEPGWTGSGSYISGGNVQLRGLMRRTTDLAATGGDATVAGAVILSSATGTARSVMGGYVDATGNVTIRAENTVARHHATATLGDIGAGSDLPTQPGFDLDDWIDAAQGAAAAAPGAAPLSTATNAGFVINREAHTDRAEAQVGGVVGAVFDMGQGGFVPLLADGAGVNAGGSLTIWSWANLDRFRKHSELGLLGGQAAVADVRSDWDITSHAVLGENSEAWASSVTIWGWTSLPGDAGGALGIAVRRLDEMGEAVATDLSAQLDETGLMADLVGLIDDFDMFGRAWSITTLNSIAAGSAGLVADYGKHAFNVSTLSGVGDGAFVDLSGDLTVEAETAGGILARRMAPPDPDARPVGGTLQVLQLDTATRAFIGDIAAGDIEAGGSQFGRITVAATDRSGGGAFAAAFGNAGETAFAGAATRVLASSLTRATVNARSQFMTGDLTVRARNEQTIASVAGAGYSAARRGVGAGFGQIDAARAVTASFGTGVGSTLALGDDNSIGAADITEVGHPPQVLSLLVVDAANFSTDVAAGSAGAQGTAAGGAADATVDADAGGGVGGQSSGFGLAADAALIRQTHTILATVETGGAIEIDNTGGSGISITAVDARDTRIATGAAVAGSGSFGIGAALSWVESAVIVQALNRGGARRPMLPGEAMNLQVVASDISRTRALAAGRTGPEVRTDVVGSMVRIIRETDVIARSEDSDIQTRVALIAAAQSGSLWAIAGAVARTLADATAGGTPAPGKGTSVGTALSWITTDDVTEAAIDGGRLAASGANPVATVRAANNADFLTTALSDGAAEENAIMGSAVIAATTRTTLATVRGLAPSAHSGTLTVNADSNGRLRARVGAVGDGEKAGFGGSALELADTRTTRARVQDSSLVAQGLFGGADLTVSATETGAVDAFQRSGAGLADDTVQGKDSFGLAYGRVATDWATRAQVTGSTLDLQRLTVVAREEAAVLNRNGQVTLANNTDFFSLGVMTTSYGSTVAARVAGSTVSLATGRARIAARSLSEVVTIATAGDRVKNGAPLLYARQAASGLVAADVVDSAITSSLSSPRNVVVLAEDATWTETRATATGEASQLGAVGVWARDIYERDVRARVAGSAIVGRNLTVTADAALRANLTAVSRAKGGGKTDFAGQVTWLVIDRDVVAQVTGSTVTTTADMAVTATRADSALMLMGTETSATIGAGVGLGFMRTRGDTRAEVIAPRAGGLVIGRDLEIAATDATAAVQVVLGTGEPGVFTGIGALGVIEMGRRPDAAAPIPNPVAADAVNDLLPEGVAVHETARDAMLAEIAARPTVVGDTAAATAKGDVNIIARLALTGAGDAAVSGDLGITATDRRSGLALAGQFQVAVIPGVISQLTEVVSITALNQSGIEIAVGDLSFAMGGDAISVRVDSTRPDGFEIGLDESGAGVGTDLFDNLDPFDFDDFRARVATARGFGGELGEADLAPDRLPPLDPAALPDPAEGAGGAEDFADATDGEAGPEGFGVGVAIGWVDIGGLVLAEVTLDAGRSAEAAGAVQVSALSDPFAGGFSAGAQIGVIQLGAGAGVALQRQAVFARVVGPGSLRGASIAVAAETTGRGSAVAAALTGAKTIAGGVTLAVNEMRADTQAVILSSDLTATGGDIAVTARNEADIPVIAAGVGAAAGGIHVGVSVGSAVSNATTAAMALAGARLTAAGAVALDARADQRVSGIVLAMSAGSGIAGAASTALVKNLSRVDAVVDAASLTAQGGNATVTATSDTGLGAASIGAAAGAGIAVSGSISVARRADTVRAQVRASEIEAEDSILIQALSGADMGALGGGTADDLRSMAALGASFSFGGTAGIGVNVAVVTTSATVLAEVLGASRLVAQGIASGSGVLAVNRLPGAAHAPRSSAIRRGVAVIADADTALRTLAAGVAGSPSGIAVQAQVPVVNVADTVRARIDLADLPGTRPRLETPRAITVLAGNGTDMTFFSAAGGLTAGVGGGGAIEYLGLRKTTEVVVNRADLAAGGALRLIAAAPDRITATTMAAGVGAVGFAGVVSVLSTRSDTAVRVSRATLEAGGTLDVIATAPREIVQRLGNFTAGAVGAGGTVMVLDAADTVEAAVADAGTAALGSTLDAGGAITIEAASDLTHDLVLVGGSGGAVAVEASFFLAKFRQTVTARLGNHARVTGSGALAVAARQDFDQRVRVGLIAIGLKSVGAAIGVISQRNTVAADIGSDVAVSSSGDVAVRASSNRELDALSIAAGGGAFAFQGSLLSVVHGRPSEVVESGAHLDIVQAHIAGGDAYRHQGRSFANGNDAAAAAMAEALEGRQAVDFADVKGAGDPDTVRAGLGARSTILTTGGDITVEALETGTQGATSGAGAIGAKVSVAGGVLWLRRASTLTVTLGSDTGLTTLAPQGRVSLRADAAVGNLTVGTPDLTIPVAGEVNLRALFGTGPTAIAGSGGLVAAGAGAIVDVLMARNMSVNLGSGVTIGAPATGTIALRVAEAQQTTADAGGLALSGKASIGGVGATARNASSLRIALSEGPATRFNGGAVDIAIARDADVAATAWGGGLAGAGVALFAQATARDMSVSEVVLGTLRVNNPSVGANRPGVAVAIDSGANVAARATTLAASLGFLGSANALATRTATAAVLGADVGVTGHDLSVRVTDARPGGGRSTIEAQNLLGSLSAARIAPINKATADNAFAATVDLGLRDLMLSGGLTVEAITNARVDANSDGFFFSGLFEFGANHAIANTETTVDVALTFLTPGRVDGRMDVVARGTDDVKSRARSSGGAAITIFGAKSLTDTDATTKVRLAGAGGISVGGTARIETERTIDLDNSSNSYQVSVADAGANRQENAIANTMAMVFDTVLEAAHITTTARNTITKSDSGFGGFNAVMGRFAPAFTTSGMQSVTRVDTDTLVELRPDAVLRQVGTAGGGVTMRVRETYDMRDAVKIDTISPLTFPKAVSVIEIETARADILIRSAGISAVGDVDLSTRTDTTLRSETYVHTYSAIGRPTAEFRLRHVSNNLIETRGPALLESREGDIRLTAGGPSQRMSARGEARVWNLTPITDSLLVPYADLRAVARISQPGQGAVFSAAGDVVLTATRGTQEAFAYASSSNSVKDFAQGVVNFFADLANLDRVNWDQERTNTRTTWDTRVEIDGVVIAGSRHRQVLRINELGGIDLREGDLEYEDIAGADLRALVEAYLARIGGIAGAIDPATQDPTLAALATRIGFETLRLQEMLAAMDGYDSVDVLLFKDLFARGGDITIETGRLMGSGSLTANGDVLIEVMSNAPRVMVLESATIPFEAKGSIRFNGAQVYDTAAIELASNEDPWTPPASPVALTLRRAGAEGPQTMIRFHNTYNAPPGMPGGDLWVTGRVENLRGTVELVTSTGNIVVFQGSVLAGGMDVFSGGDFFLSGGLAGLENLPFSPIGAVLYGDFFPQVEAGTATAADFLYREGGDTQGSLIAVGDVSIYADKLNINGLIRSGVTDWGLTIASNLEFLIDSAGLPGSTETVLYSRNVLVPELTGDGDLVPVTLFPAAIEGLGTVRWDPVARVLRIDPMLTRGGNVELVGRIISTGGGRIEVAHGMGQINIDNASSLPIVLSDLSTGPAGGVTGQIRIVDTHRPWVPGDPGQGFTVTTFRKGAEGIERAVNSSRSVLASGDGSGPTLIPVFLPLGETAQYDIAGNFALTFENGVVNVQEQTSSSFRAFWTLADGSTVTLLENPAYSGAPTARTETVSYRPRLDLTPGLPPAYAYGFDTSFSEAELRLADIGLWGAFGDRIWFLLADDLAALGLSEAQAIASGAGAGTFQPGGPGTPAVTRYAITLPTDFAPAAYQERTNALHQHSIRASYPIDIGFVGHDTGRITIDSNATVFATGDIFNPSGLVSITAQERLVVPGGAAPTTSIFVAADKTISSGRLQLRADWNILGGAPTQDATVTNIPVRLEVTDGRSVTALAANRVRLRAVSGDLAVRGIGGTGAEVRLRAAGSILTHPNAQPDERISADTLRLTAQAGSLGTADAPLQLALSGNLTATATGDIALSAPEHDLFIERVESQLGDVWLATGGSMIDRAQRAERDPRRLDGTLEDAWDRAGLRGLPLPDGSPNTRIADEIAAYEDSRTADYFFYWEIRGAERRAVAGEPGFLEPPTGFELPPRAGPGFYNPDFTFAYSEAERADLIASGLTLDEVATLEANTTARFHALHLEVGGPPITYNRNFRHVASAEEVAQITAQMSFDTTRLARGLREDLLLEQPDTIGAPRLPNITGRDVVLIAGRSIGEPVSNDDVFTIDARGTLSQADIDRLWTVERGDITRSGDTLTVAPPRDLTVIARGTLSGLAGIAPAAPPGQSGIYIISPERVAVAGLAGPGAVRLRSAVGIEAAPLAGGAPTHLAGRDILLEGGTGGIGAPGAAVTLLNYANGSLTARATGDIVLRAPTGSLRLAEVFSAAGRAQLTATAGDILDVLDTATPNIVADEITLFAQGAIGTLGNALEIDPRGGARLLEALSVTGDTVLTVAAGDATARAVGSAQARTFLTLADGNLTLDGLGALPAVGAGTELWLTVHGAITLADPAALAFAAGTAATINTRENLGSLATPLITRLGADGTPVALSINRLGTGNLGVWMINDGALSVEQLALGSGPGATFSLVNAGLVRLGGEPGAVFSPRNLNVATVAGGASAPDLLVFRDLDLMADGNRLTLLSAGDLRLNTDASLVSRGDVTLAGRVVEGAADIAVSGGGTLRITSQTALTLGRIDSDGPVVLRANGTDLAGLRASPLALSVADLRAARLEAFGAGMVAGRYHVSGDVDIEAALTLGVVAVDGTVLAPLTLVTDPDLGRVRLVGEYGAAVALETLPGQAAITLNELRTSTGLPGQFVDGAGTVRSLAEVLPSEAVDYLVDEGLAVEGPLNAWRGSGIRLTGAGYPAVQANGFPFVTLGAANGDGLGTVNAPVLIEVARFNQTSFAPITTFGGDLTIRDTGGLVPLTLAGIVSTGGGDVTVEGRQGLVQTGTINSGGGDVRLTAGAPFYALMDPVRISTVFSQGGNIVVETGALGGLQMLSGTLDAGAGRVRVAVDGDATLLGGIVSTGTFAQGNAVEIDVSGLLTTDAGSPRTAPLVTAAGPARVRIAAGRLGATAERPLPLRVGSLDLRAEAGVIHALNDGNLRLLGVESADGSLIDIFVEGDMAGAGPVISQAAGGARGDVVLTARGSIGGAFDPLVARNVQLTALEGGIGFSPLTVRQAEVGLWRVYGRDKVDLALPDSGMRAAWVISDGPVAIEAAGDVEIGLIGAGAAPQVVTSGTFTVAQRGAAQPVSLHPDWAGTVIAPEAYRSVAAAGPDAGNPIVVPPPAPPPPTVVQPGAGQRPARLPPRLVPPVRPAPGALFDPDGSVREQVLAQFLAQRGVGRPLIRDPEDEDG